MSNKDVAEHGAGHTASVACCVLTVSDSRTATSDRGGPLICAKLAEQEHTVVRAELVPDEIESIREALASMLAEASCRAVLVTGGTGVATRDVTVDAVEPMLEKSLPGFGELFRMLSYEQVGAAAMLSRALAGVVSGRVVFCLPGSPKAVELAMDRLVLPQIKHLVGLLS